MKIGILIVVKRRGNLRCFKIAEKEAFFQEADIPIPIKIIIIRNKGVDVMLKNSCPTVISTL